MVKTNTEFEAFDKAVRQLLTVPHDAIKKRMEAYKEQAAKNPRKRGPKPKSKTAPKS